jgi:hypothetical protein
MFVSSKHYTSPVLFIILRSSYAWRLSMWPLPFSFGWWMCNGTQRFTTRDNYVTAVALYVCMYHKYLPNVAVQWLTLLHRIREISGSNLGLETGYPDWGLRGYPQSFQANAGIVVSHNAAWHIISNSSFTSHPFIWRYIESLKSVVK